MAPHIAQSKDMNLVLSSDARPRLKWTPELHQRFVNAVTQLGGADKVTPKSLMSVINIHGLTLHHLKSHLQKYRLAESQLAQSYHKNREKDKLESARVLDSRKKDENSRGLKKRNYIDAELKEKQSDQTNNLQIARTLQMQMEVQRKLHQQIEVQKHLQLRIEAQGKYLQSVLKKAEKALAGHGSSVGEELSKAELTQLLSMANKCIPSSSLSEVNKIDRSITKYTVRRYSPSSSLSALAKIDGSVESSATSSDSLVRIKESRAKNDIDETVTWKRNSSTLPMMKMNQGKESDSNAEAKEINRSRIHILDDNWIERPSGKIRDTHRTNEQITKLEFLETVDLNSKCLNDFDTGPKVIDFISRCF